MNVNISSGMSYDEAQNLKEGDTVKVLFKCKSRAYCPRSGRQWINSWTEAMSEFVGRELTVKGTTPSGSVSVKEGNYSFPWFCLELVEVAPIEELTLEQVCAELGRDIKIVK